MKDTRAVIDAKDTEIACGYYPSNCNIGACDKFPCDDFLGSAERELWVQQTDALYSVSGLAKCFELDTWSRREAILILAGIDPEEAVIKCNGGPDRRRGVGQNRRRASNDSVQIVNAQPFCEDASFYDIPTIVDQWGFGPSTPGYEQVMDKRCKFDRYERHISRIAKIFDSGLHHEDRYPINDIVNWAKRKKIFISWLCWVRKQGLLNQNQQDAIPEPDQGKPAYLDESSVFYPPDLHLAVEVYEELFVRNPPRKVPPPGGFIIYIEKYLKEHYPDMGVNKVERIAIVVNPNKKGGAPST